MPLRVLVLTGQPPSLFARRCLNSGAAGFVCKHENLHEVINAAKAVMAGYTYFPSTTLSEMRMGDNAKSDSTLISVLSNRELTVLQLLAQGMSNKDIADSMFLSNKTVSTYKTRPAAEAERHVAGGTDRPRQTQQSRLAPRMPAPHRLYPRSLICLAQALLAWALLAWAPAQASQELTLVGKAAVPDVEITLDGDDWRWLARKRVLTLGVYAPDIPRSTSPMTSATKA